MAESVKAPLVSFELGGLLIGADGRDVADALEPLPGAARAIETIRKTGARSLVFSGVQQAKALAALQRAGLAVDELCVRLTSPGIEEHLAGRRPWAYIGNTLAAMRIGRRAGVVAIGITAGRYTATDLRSVGADATWPDLTEFSEHFRFTMNSKGNALRYGDAVALAGIGWAALSNWLDQGVLPTIKDAWGRQRVPRDLIVRLKQFAGDQRPQKHQAELCGLEWLARSGTYPERIDAYKRACQLVEEGRLMTARQVASRLGSLQNFIANKQSATRLVAKGILPAISVRGAYLFIASEVDALAATIDWHTAHEVAEQLGITNRSVSRLIEEGKLKAVATYQGYRISPEELARYQQERDRTGLVSARRANQLLGRRTSHHLLDSLVAAGEVEVIEVSGHKLYPEASVKAAKARREQLNPGFEEWLPQKDRGQTYGPEQTARRLGISKDYLGDLARQGIMPFIDTCAPGSTRVHRLYPAKYIEALAIFAAGGNLTASAQQFASMCKEAGTIIRHLPSA